MNFTNIKIFLLGFCTLLFFQNCKIKQTSTADNDQECGANHSKSIDTLNLPSRIFLEGYGDVVPTKVEYLKFDGYDGIEMYKIPADINVIEGIERYGAYRLYSQRPFEDSVNYHSEPKIEFLASNNKIIKTVYPLREVSLFKEPNINFKLKDRINTNQFLAEVNPKNYIDSIAFPNEFYGGNTLLDLQYDLQQGYLIAKFTYLVLDDTQLFGAGFEIIVYDNSGKELGRLKGNGAPNDVSISNNKQFIYISTGGQITEDSFAPTAFSIYQIDKNRLLFSRQGTDGKCISGFYSQPYGYFGIQTSCNTNHNFSEFYLIDDVKREILKFNFSTECPINSRITPWNNTYECYDDNDNLLSKQNLETAFNRNISF